MNNTTYHQLMVFHTIVQKGSITTAASHLGLGKAAVSKTLKQLEQQIGLTLFHRTTRKLSLTPEGKLLIDTTQTALMSLNQAVQNVQDLGNHPQGSLRITTARFAYRCILQPIMAEFCQTYPEIALEISINDGTIDILSQNFDVGIRFGNQVQAEMVARKLMKPFREGLYVSPTYLKEHGSPSAPDDLIQHKLIGYRFISANLLLPLQVMREKTLEKVEIPTSLIVNDIEVMQDAIQQGMGIGRLFEPIYEKIVDKSNIVPILKPYWQTYDSVYLYHPKNSQKTKRIQVFIDFLVKAYLHQH